jgi:CubicO group peptidase (beta-lactamase class C family)
MTQTATSLDVPIHGTCAPEYAAVREAFADNVRRRGEIGAAVCVYQDGKPVVDLWGGHKDLARTEP